MNKQEQRQKIVHEQISADLQAMSHKYDAKELAVLMFWYAVGLFRAVHSLGMWPVKEVQVFTTEAMKDMLTPLPADELPPQAIIDETGKLNPATSQRLS